MRNKNRFFMVAQWKEPKDPFTVIHAFKRLTKLHKDASLIIGGYGPQMKEMHKLASDLKLESNLCFLGKMDSVQVAKEMQKATAYVHCSGYETFSVVCAEALHCGCPVIASNVGGIKEFVNHENGILVENNDVESFSQAMHHLTSVKHTNVFNIDFSEETIGAKYFMVLDEISK
ncbi:glycosyltransferase [Ekhidna sp. MALMAid0563]|uniref:glycosyltransferase n=1 Tax=Ekhidna sp. MALMAid0563 TaxID=3143937 RepID=UPI0032DF6104